MAITAAAGGGNWSAGGTWVGGVAPTATDDVILASTSGNVTVDTGTCVCKSLSCTTTGNYAGVLTFTASQILSVSGSVTYSTTMTVAGTGLLKILATATLTSNTQTHTGDLYFSAAATFTMGDNWTVNGLTIVTGGAPTINGNQITCKGSLTVNFNTTGTTLFIMGGTGTISTANSSISLSNNLTINTAGTITIGTALGYTTGTITYTAGTIAGTGVLYINGNCTLNTNGMTWPQIYIRIAGSVITRTSDVQATYVVYAAASATWAGAFNLTCSYYQVSNQGAGSISAIHKAGTTLTVTTEISGFAPRMISPVTTTILSDTGSSSFNLNFTGPISGMRLYQVTFTDVDASGSQQPILNFNGGTLTRCKNIYNKTLGNQLTGPSKVGMVYTSQGQPENVTWS